MSQAPGEFLGAGDSGVPADSQLRRDLEGLSDRAKRVEQTRRPAAVANAAQNLRAATGGGGQIQSLDDQAADQVLTHLRTKENKTVDPAADPAGYMDELLKRIKEMEKQANDVKISGTGNVAASNTYMQVAQILRKRLRTLQSQNAGLGEGQ